MPTSAGHVCVVADVDHVADGGRHTPVMHDSPVAQGVSHAPQWSELVWVSVQSPPQTA